MDFLLVCPPVSNFGQAPAALSVLTAYLRSFGWQAAQWDLGIEAFHHLYDVQRLRQCREKLVQLQAEQPLLELADRVLKDIDSAKAALRTPGIGADESTMRWALHTIDDASALLTASSGGRWELQDSKFLVTGALNGFDELASVCSDPDRNPFVEFVRDHAMPRLVQDTPKSVGISITYLSQLIPGLTLARAIRQQLPGVPIILGGSYLTATAYELVRVPVSTLIADAVVIHDGEQALDAWLRLVLKGVEPPKFPNLLIARDNRYHPAGVGPIPQVDLNTLPVPMWTSDGLRLDQYVTPTYPIALPLTRGCHWGKCTFCNISSQTSSTYRCRSVDLAVKDIEAAIEETGSNWFDFPVDSFRPRDLWQLARAIIDRGIRIQWGAEVLLDGGFRDEVIADLARSGCRCLRFGLESACLETLQAMGKATRPGLARRILGSCRAHGIRTAVMFIVGFPTETSSNLRETFDFVVDNRDRIDFLTFHGYSLVMGSPIALDPGKFGLYLKSGRAVFSPNLPFVNTNPGGIQEHHLSSVIDPMRESLREYYPDLGELFTVGIGGWMTFANCCESEVEAIESCR